MGPPGMRTPGGRVARGGRSFGPYKRDRMDCPVPDHYRTNPRQFALADSRPASRSLRPMRESIVEDLLFFMEIPSVTGAEASLADALMERLSSRDERTLLTNSPTFSLP